MRILTQNQFLEDILAVSWLNCAPCWRNIWKGISSIASWILPLILSRSRSTDTHLGFKVTSQEEITRRLGGGYWTVLFLEIIRLPNDWLAAAIDIRAVSGVLMKQSCRWCDEVSRGTKVYSMATYRAAMTVIVKPSSFSKSKK